MSKREWYFTKDGRRLASFLGAYGYKPRLCKNISDLITMAINVFNIKAVSNCSDAVEAILAIRKDQRRKFVTRPKKKPKPVCLPIIPKPKAIHKPRKNQIDTFYSSWEWKRARYDFLLDNPRKCGCCGATPNHGERIVVDHIKPIRRYWHLRLDPTNFQQLCDDCNMGKGSRDETDWRSDPLAEMLAIPDPGSRTIN